MSEYQKTINNQISCSGIGIHTGENINLTLKPSDANTGIIFIRTDVKAGEGIVVPLYNNVTKTTLGTTISNEYGTEISTIEHLMAALWGCGIDNCIIELDGPEAPIMDGSSEPFIFLLECAGVKKLDAHKKILKILKTVTIKDEKTDGFITIEPFNGYKLDVEIDFNDKVISNQKYIFNSQNFSFKSELSRARTFGFAHEVEYLQKMGLAKGGSLLNAIVIDGDKILNSEKLRYKDEFVRHKVLDCIGDLFLCGHYIQGNVKGYKLGHDLNNKLLRKLFADSESYVILEPDDVAKINNNKDIEINTTETAKVINFA